MIKNCVLLNGEIINIGDWDYQIRSVQTGEDAEGNPIYEDQETNPLPAGATIEQRDMEYDPDRGWYIVGTSKPKTAIELLQEENDALKQQNAQISTDLQGFMDYYFSMNPEV